MKKIERLQNIIYLLSHKNRLSAYQLADIFEVSERTIYRDIDALSQMNVPIIAYEGIGGGYELDESYFFKTVKLNDRELLLMSLLLEVGEQLNTTDFDESIVTLKHKVLNSLDSKIDVSEILENVTIDIRNIYPEKIKKGVFDTVLESLKNKKLLNIDYFTPLKDTITKRDIAPIDLLYTEGCWYLYSYCYLKNSIRIFRLDRITNCILLTDNVDRRVYDLEVNKELPVEIIMEIDKGLFKLVKGDSFMQETTIIEEKDNSYIVKVKVVRVDSIVNFSFRNVDKVTVISPLSVIEEIKDKVKKMKEIYLH